MFKKKIDLSALINKNEQENKETSNSDVITSSLSEENTNIEPIIIEKKEDIEIKISETTDIITEEKPKKKIWIKKNNSEDEKNNSKEKTIEIEKNEDDINSNEEIKYNYTNTVETYEENKNIEQNIDENQENIDNSEIIIKDEKKDNKKKKEEKKIETPEEIEKRYEEMTSKIEIKKETAEYNKDDNSDLFWNYKSDFEIKNKTEEKIQDELWNKIEELSSEKDWEFKVSNENIKNEKKDENIIIKPKNSKKIIKILILLLIISIIWSISYFFNDIKKLIINDNITTNTWDTNSGIIDTIDPEIKDEVNDYIEQIKKDNSELTPEEIKKKINDKIIEIYLKKAMTK